VAPLKGQPKAQQKKEKAPKEVERPKEEKTVPSEKDAIAARLFPLIEDIEPELADRITGMMLEMPAEDLLILLDDVPALRATVGEAMKVLRKHLEQES
jgi:hypothetical protein